MLAPVLGFVDFGYMRLSLVADRYAYLAGIGVIAVLVGAAAHVRDRLPHVPGAFSRGSFRRPLTRKEVPAFPPSPEAYFHAAAAAALAVVLAIFGKLSWDQIAPYRDKITYFSHVISLNPEGHLYQNLAQAQFDAGRLTEALATSRIVLQRSPDAANGHNLQGEVLVALERFEEAEDSFRRMLELDPDDVDAHVNLGVVGMHQERWAEAANWFREALERDPEDALAHGGLGEVLFRLGRYAQAAESLRRAVSLQPDEVDIHTLYYLADALRRQRRNEEAIERYRDVLEMDPEFARAHSGIGYMLFDLRRYEESLEWLARSVSLDPDAPDVAYQRTTMGRASEALGRNAEAAEHYARALALDPALVRTGHEAMPAAPRTARQSPVTAMPLDTSSAATDDAPSGN